ncbi:MAG: RNB domain-containing ribonuclease [Anaerolineae bacterium]
MPRQGSLVLYKNRPARVVGAGDRLEIELEGGDRLRVRPKDVVLLHPGLLNDLGELTPQQGEVQTAWELLAGGTTTLAELAELVYGVYTPATAWAAWELVADGLYFRGTPEEVLACTPEQVAREQAAREARAAEREAWAAFLERARAGQVLVEDGRYLQEVEQLALGRGDRSRVLRELGRTESPENAHATLLELGYWDHTVVPYPQRLGLATSPPDVELPELPGEERADLTHLPAFAIDDEGNQDPDDALSLEEGRLWVHVADVAALVSPESVADLEARARGATLYLPDGQVPMLPRQAIQRLGLGLAEVSPALSFGLALGQEGEIIDLEVVPSWVRVTRLSYEEAEARLDEQPFQALYQLAQINHARRQARQAINIQLPEVRVRVEDGRVNIRPLSRLRSRDMVLEAMLMAGEAAARYARHKDIPFPFTTQDPPDIQDRPQEGDMAGMFALRRALKPATYTSVPAPHAGLGLELYAQVTSPLRRYLDLVAHQQLRAHLRGAAPLEAGALLERVGAATAASQAVRQAERLARRHWTLVYLIQNPDWRGEGVVVELRERRALVLVPELDLEALVHLRQALPLNSLVQVAVEGVNLAELDVYLKIVS